MLDMTQRTSNDPAFPQAELPPRDTIRPLRFWEVHDFFSCPVVGMCLTHGEQQQLLKKNGFTVKKRNAFEMHETLVASSGSENRLSRRVDRLLTRKFGQAAAELIALSDEAFMAAFRSAVETGDHAASLWAAATHPTLPVALRREVFGVIHDGYMNKGARTLEKRLRRADVVLCPVSCNSHAACSIVKNLAKKHNKTVHMLPNSSLTSISQAIWGENDCRHTVN